MSFVINMLLVSGEAPPPWGKAPGRTACKGVQTRPPTSAPTSGLTRGCPAPSCGCLRAPCVIQDVFIPESVIQPRPMSTKCGRSSPCPKGPPTSAACLPVALNPPRGSSSKVSSVTKGTVRKLDVGAKVALRERKREEEEEPETEQNQTQTHVGPGPAGTARREQKRPVRGGARVRVSRGLGLESSDSK